MNFPRTNDPLAASARRAAAPQTPATDRGRVVPWLLALSFAAVASLSALSAIAQTAAPPTRLPQRNLLVEVRQGDESQFSAEAGGLRSGAVTIGPDGKVQARAGVTIESRSRDASGSAVTQLRVLNGGQGMLAMGVSAPVVWYDVVLTPQGPAVIGRQGLQDTGRRVAVRPRWPGGSQPVTVEVSTEASAIAGGGIPSRYQFDGQPQPAAPIESAGLLTTLQLPLGEWVTVASEAGSQAVRERGVVSSTSASRERRFVVQMRITAP